MTLVGGAGDNHARVTAAGELYVRDFSSHDRQEQLDDFTLLAGGSHQVYTSTCGVTQIYAYPIREGALPAQPNMLGIKVPFPARSDAPAESLDIAAWDSGTPTSTGVVHPLTLTALANALRFGVGKGTYGWRVIVSCTK